MIARIANLIFFDLGAYFLLGLTLRPIRDVVESQRQFIANVSHELRTPLALMKTESEVAWRSQDNFSKEEAISLLKRNVTRVDHIARIVQFFLILSDFNSKDSQELEYVVSLKNKLAIAEEQLSAQIEKKRIKVSYVYTSKNVRVKGNPVALEKLTLNLVRNAVAYTPEEGKIVLVLHYPTGTLQALSVSKGSLFTLWVEEPTLSSGAGTVSFNGGVPNPGVSSSGTAVSVTFKALRSGTATLSLTGAAVRANDGLGTNVLSGSSGTQVTITQAIVAPTPTPTTPKPTAPVEPVVAKGPVDITSSSHPSSESWYQDASPYFSWTLPKGATAVQLGIDTSATEAPTVSYTKPISEKTIENLEDGTWYFRMRYRSGGVWSEISTYRVKIDATAPTFNALEALYDENESAVFVRTEGIDDASGVVGYEVTLDDGKTKTYNPQDVENKSIRVPVHSSGLHTLKVTLIDAAGNRTTEERTFSAPQTLLNQTLFKIGPVHISLLIALLTLTFISLLSIFIAVFEWLYVRKPRARRSSAIPVVRKGMHQAFLKMKANMEKDVRALDRARTRRELSKEELMLYRRLLANLTALERHLDQILEEAE